MSVDKKITTCLCCGYEAEDFDVCPNCQKSAKTIRYIETEPESNMQADIETDIETKIIKPYISSKNCFKCRKDLDEKSRFCKNCGYATPLGQAYCARKGIVRIICGSILLLLTAIALIGEYMTYKSYKYQYYSYNTQPKFNILDYSAYLIWALCGFLLLFFGVRAYKNGDTATMILHKIRNKYHIICNYFFGSLLTVYLIVSIRNLFGYHLDIEDFILNFLGNSHLIFRIIALSFFIVYFFFYTGSKPSVLFSNGLLFWGISILYNWLDHIYIIQDYGLYFVLQISLGTIYVILSIVLYRENFSTKSVKLLGFTTFLLIIFTLVIVYTQLNSIILTIDLIPPTTIFVYTCIMPMYSGKIAPIETSVNS